jgi:hypothetical protein
MAPSPSTSPDVSPSHSLAPHQNIGNVIAKTPRPTHVIVDGDLASTLASWATVAAIIVAVIALWVAVQARKDLVRERRYDFELDLLRRLIDLNEKYGPATFTSPESSVLVRMLPAHEFPLLTLTAGLPADGNIQTLLEGLEGTDRTDRHRELLRKELVNAIARRLERRPNEYSRSEEVIRAGHAMFATAMDQVGKHGEVQLTISVDKDFTPAVLRDIADKLGATLTHAEDAKKATFTKAKL